MSSADGPPRDGPRFVRGARGVAMSDPKLQPQPTMDEILASIRRIISEDQKEGGGAGAESPADRDDTVLELTDIVGDADAVGDTPAAAAAPSPPRTAGDSDAEVDLQALVSGEAARRTSAAFVDLAEQIERSGGAALAGGRTLDELVKDLLRPMLKAWLDENLPPLVQRLVEAEIARLAGRPEEK